MVTYIPVQGRQVTPEERLKAVPVDCANHSSSFGWQGIRVEDYPNLPPSNFASPAMTHHLLVYHYKALRGTFRHQCAGRTTTTRLHDGQFSFIPAGADNHWTFGEGRPAALHILIDARALEAATETQALEFRDDFQVDAPILQTIARRLRTELARGGPTGPLFADTILQMLSVGMLQLFTDHRPETETADCNVAAARDLIHEESERALSLAELATLCHISQSQLLRAFRQRYGTTPHRYLLERRIEKAKHILLAEKDKPLAEIALDLGYADQSHMSRAFVAATGVTPRRFRRPL